VPIAYEDRLVVPDGHGAVAPGLCGRLITPDGRRLSAPSCGLVLRPARRQVGEEGRAGQPVRMPAGHRYRRTGPGLGEYGNVDRGPHVGQLRCGRTAGVVGDRDQQLALDQARRDNPELAQAVRQEVYVMWTGCWSLAASASTSSTSVLGGRTAGPDR
jgi:hypothetical protein